MPNLFQTPIGQMPAPDLRLDNPHILEEIIRTFVDFNKKNEAFHSETTHLLNQLKDSEKQRDTGYLQCVKVLNVAADDSKQAKEISQKALAISEQTAADVAILKTDSTKLDAVIESLKPLESLKNELSLFIAVQSEVKGTISLGTRIAKKWKWISGIAITWSVFTGHASSAFDWVLKHWK